MGEFEALIAEWTEIRESAMTKARSGSPLILFRRPRRTMILFRRPRRTMILSRCRDATLTRSKPGKTPV